MVTKTHIAAVVALICLSVSTANAQERPLNLRRVPAGFAYEGAVAPLKPRVPAFQAAPPRPRRSIGRKVIGGALGVVGGFVVGGYVGGALEGNCRCDDPGLKGFLIGAPIGAVSLGILGAKFF